MTACALPVFVPAKGARAFNGRLCPEMEFLHPLRCRRLSEELPEARERSQAFHPLRLATLALLGEQRQSVRPAKTFRKALQW